jgi:hypothetical protein
MYLNFVAEILLRLALNTNQSINIFCSLPDVYTQFRKSVESNCSVRKILDIDVIKPVPDDIEEGKVPTIEDLGCKCKLSIAKLFLTFISTCLFIKIKLFLTCY